jgi:hypothetical protein
MVNAPYGDLISYPYRFVCFLLYSSVFFVIKRLCCNRHKGVFVKRVLFELNLGNSK